MPGGRVFLTADAVGGVWQYALDLAREYVSRGMAVDLAIVGPCATAGRLAEAEAVPGLTVLYPDLPLDWMADSKADAVESGAALARLAKRRKPDVVHLNAAGLGGGQAWPAPLVVTLHSCVATWWHAVRHNCDLPDDLTWRRSLVEAGLMEADAVIVPSASFATAARAAYPRMTPPAVVHNGRMPPPGTGLAAERSDAVFTCGRLWDAAKNAAALDTAASVPGLRIFAAGPVANPMGGTIALPNLDLLGDLTSRDIRCRMRSSGVFVSVARYEPFGLSVLEAAQAGCALVLSDIPTFRELWNGAATFVNPDRPEQIARTIKALAAAPETRIEWGRRAQRRASRYSCAAMASHTLAVYERVRQRPALAGGMA